ncbi:hypothetical protein V8E53_009720 [Lactarius tabidus]
MGGPFSLAFYEGADITSSHGCAAPLAHSCPNVSGPWQAARTSPRPVLRVGLSSDDYLREGPRLPRGPAHMTVADTLLTRFDNPATKDRDTVAKGSAGLGRSSSSSSTSAVHSRQKLGRALPSGAQLTPVVGSTSPREVVTPLAWVSQGYRHVVDLRGEDFRVADRFLGNADGCLLHQRQRHGRPEPRPAQSWQIGEQLQCQQSANKIATVKSPYIESPWEFKKQKKSSEEHQPISRNQTKGTKAYPTGAEREGATAAAAAIRMTMRDAFITRISTSGQGTNVFANQCYTSVLGWGLGELGTDQNQMLWTQRITLQATDSIGGGRGGRGGPGRSPNAPNTSWLTDAGTAILGCVIMGRLYLPVLQHFLQTSLNHTQDAGYEKHRKNQISLEMQCIRHNIITPTCLRKSEHRTGQGIGSKTGRRRKQSPKSLAPGPIQVKLRDCRECQR